MATNKIIKHNLEETAHQLKTEGYSDSEIATSLSEESGEKISRYSVLRYFQSNGDAVQQRVKQREEVVEKAIDERLDVVKQLNQINKAAMHFLRQALESNDSNKAMKAMREVREQLEFQAKLLGDLPDQQVNINVEGDLIKFEQRIIQIVYEVLCDECRNEFAKRMEEYGEQFS